MSLLDRPIFKRPLDFINQYLQQIDDLMSNSCKATQNFLKLKRKDLEILTVKLNTINPNAVLKRGYSITLKKGRIIKNASDVKIDEIIEIMFQKGEIKSQVKEVKNG